MATLDNDCLYRGRYIDLPLVLFKHEDNLFGVFDLGFETFEYQKMIELSIDGTLLAFSDDVDILRDVGDLTLVGYNVDGKFVKGAEDASVN